MKNLKLILYALVQSLGVFIYISGIVWVLFNADKWIGKNFSLWQPVMTLMLLVISAAVTGTLVFGRSVYFYLEGLKKESILVFIYTISFLALITLSVFLGRFIL